MSWPEDLIDQPLEYKLVEPIVILVGVQEGWIRKRKALWNLRLANGQERTLLYNLGQTHHKCHSYLVLCMLSATDLLILFLVDIQGVWKIMVE